MDGTLTNGRATKERPAAEPTTHFGWDHQGSFEEFFSELHVTLPDGETRKLALPEKVMVSVIRSLDAENLNVLRLKYPRKEKKPLGQILSEWSEYLILGIGLLLGAGLYRNLAYYLGW